MKRKVIAVCLIGFMVICAGCATVGFDFQDNYVSKIHIGKTTQNEVRNLFGSPWRVGIEDGKQTWTYGRYTYRLLGESSTKDLVIRFNDKSIVSSYTYNTTEHQE